MKIQGVKYEQSPNFTDKYIEPIGIIIHWTGGTFESSKSWILNDDSQVSAHFVIDVNGETIQLVDTNKIAWHAGKSETKYGKYCNNYAIGIELAGPPSKLNLKGWDDRQIMQCASLCKELNKFHKLLFITDHSTVSPGRKVDVKKGYGIDKFDWEQLVIMSGIDDYKN